MSPLSTAFISQVFMDRDLFVISLPVFIWLSDLVSRYFPLPVWPCFSWFNINNPQTIKLKVKNQPRTLVGMQILQSSWLSWNAGSISWKLYNPEENYFSLSMYQTCRSWRVVVGTQYIHTQKALRAELVTMYVLYQPLLCTCWAICTADDSLIKHGHLLYNLF